jgi:ubiquinone/menaquinone biosynthesis C-methylase UbiE
MLEPKIIKGDTMKRIEGITLKNVNEVYDGPEGKLWELIMGEQIHVAGFKSSMELAKRAGVRENQKVLDLCSALGAGLRFLVKNFKVQGFGLDGTKTMFEEAKKRAREENLADKIEFKFGNVEDIPWPDGAFDVVWGEDAWCYVEHKEKLISSAARVLKKGGTIAFTDWIEGPRGMNDSEAKRICTFMKFPYVETLKGYRTLLEANGFAVREASDLTPEFAEYCKFYIKMLTDQLTYDALRIIGDNMELFQMMGGEMMFMAETSAQGKFGRARFIATKK